MKILAIESSCDETAASLVQFLNEKCRVLRNVVLSQVKIHAKYGGVVPEVAARKHVEGVIPILQKTLVSQKENIDLITVTAGPGLITSLMVGIETAKALSYLWRKPLLGVNHLEGHIYSNWLSNPKFFKSKEIFPAICLVVSGGHTELYLMKGHGQYKLLGRTRDDAVGEAFDKVAKILNIGYPGGPIISYLAEKGDTQTFNFPRPMLESQDFDFSFSGLKTAVLYEAKKYKKPLTDKIIADFCASFQKAAIEVLAAKTIKAAKVYKVKNIMLSGGVSANKELREELNGASGQLGIKFYCPDLKYTGDNAAMIAVAGYYNYLNLKNKKSLLNNWQRLKSQANWELTLK